MLIVMKKGSTREDLARVTGLVKGMGLTPHVLEGADHTIVEVTGHAAPLDPGSFESLPGVSRAVPVGRPFPLAARASRPQETRIPLRGRTIGGGGVFIIAGPCAVESEEQLLQNYLAVVDEIVTTAELPMIAVDRTRFAQILMNFGSNAVKYNRPGGTVTFTISPGALGS
jgi:hypothetical protein